MYQTSQEILIFKRMHSTGGLQIPIKHFKTLVNLDQSERIIVDFPYAVLRIHQPLVFEVDEIINDYVSVTVRFLHKSHTNAIVALMIGINTEATIRGGKTDLKEGIALIDRLTYYALVSGNELYGNLSYYKDLCTECVLAQSCNKNGKLSCTKFVPKRGRLE